VKRAGSARCRARHVQPLASGPARLAPGSPYVIVRARAEVAELADAADSKSAARKGVGVRFPSSAFVEIR
jgi:hypothetical protein